MEIRPKNRDVHDTEAIRVLDKLFILLFGLACEIMFFVTLVLGEMHVNIFKMGSCQESVFLFHPI